MKTLKFAVAIVAVAAFVFAGVAMANCGSCGAGKGHGQGQGHGACLGKGDCGGFDTASTMTLTGKVVSIAKEKCEGCGMEHVDLVVETNDDKISVRLGPAWYMDKQEEVLKKDDVVEIFASKVKHGDDNMFVAGKITRGDDVLMLRDKEGLPMWRGWRRGKA